MTIRSITRCAWVCVVSCLALTVHADDMPVKTLEIGATAPAFSLVGVDDKTYTLDSFKDAKVLALIFTCNHCPTAQAYEDRLQKLHDDFSAKGVAVVAISSNDPKALRLDELAYSEYNDTLEEMKLRAADKKMTYPYLYDGDTQTAARAYGPVATPQVFIFDAARTLRYRGHVDDGERGNDPTAHDARNAIEALLAGKPVPVETTGSLGCSTKWSEKRNTVADALAKWDQEPVGLEDIDAKGLEALIKNPTKKLLLLNVFATWCGPCVAEFPELVDIFRTYRIRDYDQVFVSVNDPREKERVKPFLEKYHASTRNYIATELDGEKLLASIDKDWQGEIPLTLLIAPGGKVVYKQLGMIDPTEVKKAILEQLGRKF